MNLELIKARYPVEHINALGKKDMDNIRALIAEVDRLTTKSSSLKGLLHEALGRDALCIPFSDDGFIEAIKCKLED